MENTRSAHTCSYLPSKRFSKSKLFQFLFHCHIFTNPSIFFLIPKFRRSLVMIEQNPAHSGFSQQLLITQTVSEQQPRMQRVLYHMRHLRPISSNKSKTSEWRRSSHARGPTQPLPHSARDCSSGARGARPSRTRRSPADWRTDPTGPAHRIRTVPTCHPAATAHVVSQLITELLHYCTTTLLHYCTTTLHTPLDTSLVDSWNHRWNFWKKPVEQGVKFADRSHGCRFHSWLPPAKKEGEISACG